MNEQNSQQSKLFPSPNTGGDDGETKNNSNTTHRRLPTVLWSKPKRPLSAYNIFFQQERKRILRERGTHSTPSKRAKRGSSRPHNSIGFADLARAIAPKWKAISPQEKARLEGLALNDKKRYNEEAADWKRRLVKAQEEEIIGDKAESTRKRPPEEIIRDEADPAGKRPSEESEPSIAPAQDEYKNHTGNSGRAALVSQQEISVRTVQRQGKQDPGDQTVHHAFDTNTAPVDAINEDRPPGPPTKIQPTAFASSFCTAQSALVHRYFLSSGPSMDQKMLRAEATFSSAQSKHVHCRNDNMNDEHAVSSKKPKFTQPAGAADCCAGGEEDSPTAATEQLLQTALQSVSRCYDEGGRDSSASSGNEEAAMNRLAQTLEEKEGCLTFFLETFL